MVIHLISDLIRKSDVRAAFNQDPNAVMQEYGLDTAAKCVIYSMHPQTIADAIQAEVMSVTTDFMEGEFPPTDVNCLPEAGAGQPTYPVPTPEIFRLRPQVVSIADHPSGVFEFSVFGQSFSRPSRIVVQRQGTANKLTVTGEYLFGTYRCSHARGVVTLPGEAGTYDVFIEICPGQAGSKLVSAPYTLEITA